MTEFEELRMFIDRIVGLTIIVLNLISFVCLPYAISSVNEQCEIRSKDERVLCSVPSLLLSFFIIKLLYTQNVFKCVNKIIGCTLVVLHIFSMVYLSDRLMRINTKCAFDSLNLRVLCGVPAWFLCFICLKLLFPDRFPQFVYRGRIRNLPVENSNDV